MRTGINWKAFFEEIRDVLILGFLGVFMTWAGLSCHDCYDNTREFWIIASFTAVMWIALWKGNSYIGRYCSKKISWIDEPTRRFIVGLVSTIVFTFSALYLLGNIYDLLFGIYMVHGAMYSVIITIIISLFMHGRSFLKNWKQAAINTEKLQRENIAAKYESLKNQINPHFLFNSFNALSNLVYEDPDKAVRFIKQLSEVYRYVLDTREKEIVPLREELKFLESYLYLQHIRFGEKLKVDMALQDADVYVAPLAIQMLIENAIKHNIVSEDEPLRIRLYMENDFIVVENKLQRKTTLGEPSAGVGLENICKRYDFLTDRKVEIMELSNLFIVKLPVLKKTA